LNNILVVANNELKQQLKRKAIYITFLIITLLVTLDVFPLMYSKELIIKSADFSVYQRLCFRVSDGASLFYYLIIVILVSSRIVYDKKVECMDIIMALPISKFQYIVGKILGNIILFSGLSFCTMSISLLANALFNPVAIKPIYIIFYYIVDIELTIIFATIIVTAISILTKNPKISSFICIGYLAFSILTNSKSVAAYFTIFGNKYGTILRNLSQTSSNDTIAGFANLSFILGALVLFIILSFSISLKSGDRKI
jgi:ABC-type transport system involved in multi-copper enzyme maturation permease subunit